MQVTKAKAKATVLGVGGPHTAFLQSGLTELAVYDQQMPLVPSTVSVGDLWRGFG